MSVAKSGLSFSFYSLVSAAEELLSLNSPTSSTIQDALTARKYF